MHRMLIAEEEGRKRRREREERKSDCIHCCVFPSLLSLSSPLARFADLLCSSVKRIHYTISLSSRVLLLRAGSAGVLLPLARSVCRTFYSSPCALRPDGVLRLCHCRPDGQADIRANAGRAEEQRRRGTPAFLFLLFFQTLSFPSSFIIYILRLADFHAL